ncbi:nitronate monooxygenase [Lysinibacillus sp. FSL M8-0216]|uniref:Probable nitronate monooxygenase n=1 Tax=Lysinibacillus fusiformis TaxID=28031 RepID=A0A1H9I7R7_9BACI|nr:nitronate monooxygenase [Lysinibacillus fusiformis]HAU33424.1 nitronate monooxygenase [Lysinibacillus sp.]MCG7437229.1 nitronate monooxygenase [Lysinibacillus fusiformis]NOG28878.1 nitronate monooxygenase [Lysinibacillus fusiformis]SCX56176.1 nitronate monooxygenase [Lysinibacillus fusiformis]SCY39156.1 nitronate monooxygenase [Lysinibacillus fusiformis]
MLQTILDSQQPIIQAPMAGVTSPKFVAACTEAGLLGSIGAGYLDGEQTKQFIQEVKKLTTKPFAVNLFVQEEPQIDIEVLQKARMALQPFYDELGLSPVQSVVSKEVFAGQVQAVIEENVKICSFTFGIPSAEVLQQLKEHGVYTIGTATTLAEAQLVEQAGMDAVVLQGGEAGGHRGSFTAPLQLIPLYDLLQQVAGNIAIPIIAAGGLVTKEDIQKALESGAQAVQVGTVLLVAEECEISPLYKNAVLASKEQETTITLAFTGKPARGLANDFTRRMKDATVAPYPLQNYLTTTIRKESAEQGNAEYLSMWMGENSHLVQQTGTVKSIVDKWL